MVRLYVGGLPPDVGPSDISLRFSPFGQVQAVELAQPKEMAQPGGPQQHRGFGHVDLQPKDANSVARCLSSVSARPRAPRKPLAAAAALARAHARGR